MASKAFGLIQIFLFWQKKTCLCRAWLECSINKTNRCTLTHLHLMFWALLFFFFLAAHLFDGIANKGENPSWGFARNFCNDVQKVPYVQISNSHFVMCSLYQWLKGFACQYQLSQWLLNLFSYLQSPSALRRKMFPETFCHFSHRSCVLTVQEVTRWVLLRARVSLERRQK